MKHLKLFESSFDSHIHIHKICAKYGIKNYTINSDGSIDVDGYVYLNSGWSKKMTLLPLKFRNVSGDFNCSNNQLTSFEECPQHIGGHFNCSNNQLTSFEGCPQHIGAHFNCIDNPVWYVWRLFLDYSKIEFFNDCDIIRDNKVIIIDRLNFFLEEIGEKPVKSVEGYKCI